MLCTVLAAPPLPRGVQPNIRLCGPVAFSKLHNLRATKERPSGMFVNDGISRVYEIVYGGEIDRRRKINRQNE